jgi:single-stranded DNA-binding protein
MPDINGLIEEIYDEFQVTQNFVKLAFVVKYFQNGNQQYPEFLQFELHGKNTSIMDSYNIGDSVTVHFNLRGRPWTNKEGKRVYFNSFVAWKVLRHNWDSQAGKMPQSNDDWNAKPPPSPNNWNSSSSADDDDLPF